jgi:hypothetical protein
VSSDCVSPQEAFGKAILVKRKLQICTEISNIIIRCGQCAHIPDTTQGEPGGKVNILRGHSICHSKQNIVTCLVSRATNRFTLSGVKRLLLSFASTITLYNYTISSVGESVRLSLVAGFRLSSTAVIPRLSSESNPL